MNQKFILSRVACIQACMLLQVLCILFCQNTYAEAQCSTTPLSAYHSIMASDEHLVDMSYLYTNTHTSTNDTATSRQTTLLNINTAHVSDLIELPNIGVNKAQAIVEYRQKIGGFTDIKQLLEIKGIGKKTLAKFEDTITLQ